MSDLRTEKEIIAEAYSDEAARNWRAPVQGYPPGIPWPLHLEAYEAYAKKWSKQTALIDLKGRGCRGGFGADELDGFVPGWRERVSYIGRLATEIEALRRENQELMKALEPFAEIAPLVEVTDKRDGERVHEQRRPDGTYFVLTRDDFRRARAALTMSDIHCEQLDRPRIKPADMSYLQMLEEE